MKNKIINIILIVTMGLWFAACSEDEAKITGPTYDDNALVSMSVTSAPTMDGNVDALWADARTLTFENVVVPNYSFFWSDYVGDTYNVTAKSVYTDTDIYFLFQWTGDASESLQRESWYFNSTANSWMQMPKKEPDEYGVNPAYEDKFAVIWNNNNTITNFNSQGCGVICHGEYMATNADGELGDTWHWKRVRTGPTNLLDDKYIEFSTGNGRKSDPKTSGGYKNNKQTLEVITALGDTLTYTVPKYWIPGRTDYHWILDTEIAAGTAKLIVSIDTTTMALSDEDGNGLSPGDFSLTSNILLPSVYVSAFVGDRGDVAAYHNYSGGKWNLELKRKLVTGNNLTDIQFDDLDDEYYFSIAVFDGAAIAHAIPGGMIGYTYKLQFE
ncbi:MAG: hypothetical protein IIB39_04245 [Candidatus Marinimicrobia bacterium]|nr:hypothetical protein [Candidatus Neomarinimicrobiota bacterium]